MVRVPSRKAVTEIPLVKTRFVRRRVDYDGSQIESLWAYRAFRIQGDSIVAFKGACEIPFRNMVDLEDILARSRIAGPWMLHFVAEHFNADLERAVLRQRLLVCAVKDELEARCRKRFQRMGDDLFDGTRKLSISIATVTPLSSKIHLGINIRRATGVGVPTAGLEDYGVAPDPMARAVLHRYGDEMDGVYDARTRVRGVR